jgi:hypothetical protein
MYTANELMFPPEQIAQLRDMRGPDWQCLVDRVANLPDTHEEKLAFLLMMIRINGCIDCETDSFRAMRGCDQCAIQTLRRYKGSDADLLKLYQQALSQVQEFDRLVVRLEDKPQILKMSVID